MQSPPLEQSQNKEMQDLSTALLETQRKLDQIYRLANETAERLRPLEHSQRQTKADFDHWRDIAEARFEDLEQEQSEQGRKIALIETQHEETELRLLVEIRQNEVAIQDLDRRYLELTAQSACEHERDDEAISGMAQRIAALESRAQSNSELLEVLRADWADQSDTLAPILETLANQAHLKAHPLLGNVHSALTIGLCSLTALAEDVLVGFREFPSQFEKAYTYGEIVTGIGVDAAVNKLTDVVPVVGPLVSAVVNGVWEAMRGLSAKIKGRAFSEITRLLSSDVDSKVFIEKLAYDLTLCLEEMWVLIGEHTSSIDLLTTHISRLLMTVAMMQFIYPATRIQYDIAQPEIKRADLIVRMMEVPDLHLQLPLSVRQYRRKGTLTKEVDGRIRGTVPGYLLKRPGKMLYKPVADTAPRGGNRHAIDYLRKRDLESQVLLERYDGRHGLDQDRQLAPFQVYNRLTYCKGTLSQNDIDFSEQEYFYEAHPPGLPYPMRDLVYGGIGFYRRQVKGEADRPALLKRSIQFFKRATKFRARLTLERTQLNRLQRWSETLRRLRLSPYRIFEKSAIKVSQNDQTIYHGVPFSAGDDRRQYDRAGHKYLKYGALAASNALIERLHADAVQSYAERDEEQIDGRAPEPRFLHLQRIRIPDVRAPGQQIDFQPRRTPFSLPQRDSLAEQLANQGVWHLTPLTHDQTMAQRAARLAELTQGAQQPNGMRQAQPAVQQILPLAAAHAQVALAAAVQPGP